MKLNKAIERNVILENEIQAKDNLNENNQRLKDELNGMNPPNVAKLVLNLLLLNRG